MRRGRSNVCRGRRSQPSTGDQKKSHRLPGVNVRPSVSWPILCDCPAILFMKNGVLSSLWLSPVLGEGMEFRACLLHTSGFRPPP